MHHEERNGVVFSRTDLIGVPHGFSARLGGVSRGPYESLNLGLGKEKEAPDIKRENFRRFCAAIGVDSTRLVCARQVHLDRVRVVTADDAGKGLDRERDYEADALITDVPGLPLAVFSADCTPILFHDPVRGVIGACHAGWRGTALGIAAKTVDKMARVYGCDPARIRCAIGPCISRCCFETREDVPRAMTAALGEEALPFLEDRRDGHFQMDLKGINALWLKKAGVLEKHIDISGDCTCCRPELYFSHRRTGLPRGAMAHIIQLV